jgi:hypothetical protein
MTRSWYVGDVWRPRIDVLDPESGEPIDLEGQEPTARVIAPSGLEDTPTFEEEDGALRVSIELTDVGPWRLIVETPAPHKDVEVASVYANPVKD